VYFPRTQGYLQQLKRPGALLRQLQLKSAAKAFLDRSGAWREASKFRFFSLGANSTVFSFRLQDQDFVMRIGLDVSAYCRDSLVARFAGHFPVPRVFETGNFDETRHYAISEKMPGWELRMLPLNKALKMLPLLSETAGRIHAADISGSRGFGVFDHAGNGVASSWKEFLLSYHRYRDSDQWKKDLAGNIPGAGLLDHCLKRMEVFIPCCPERRRLVHGDFSFNNILSDGRRITGVVDWQYCSAGDEVFDFATSHFWYGHSPLGKAWFGLFIEKLGHSENFDERFKCYLLKSAIGGLLNAILDRRPAAYHGRLTRVRHFMGMLDKPVVEWQSP
jgi:hygromycin-B 4-O-kinase